MKRKNVVLLYDLLLEMLDANTSQSSRMLAADTESTQTNHTSRQQTALTEENSQESHHSPR